MATEENMEVFIFNLLVKLWRRLKIKYVLIIGHRRSCGRSEFAVDSNWRRTLSYQRQPRKQRLSISIFELFQVDGVNTAEMEVSGTRSGCGKAEREIKGSCTALLVMGSCRVWFLSSSQTKNSSSVPTHIIFHYNCSGGKDVSCFCSKISLCPDEDYETM